MFKGMDSTFRCTSLGHSIIHMICSSGQKGHFTVNTVTGGAAEKAGVCKGDRLVWMNGATVEDLTHSALSKMVM